MITTSNHIDPIFVANMAQPVSFIDSLTDAEEKVNKETAQEVNKETAQFAATESGIAKSGKLNKETDAESDTEATDASNYEPITAIQTRTFLKEEKLIKLIKENPNITAKEMAERCHISVAGVYYTLRRSKRIKHEGSTKAGRWVIKERK